MTIVDAVRQTSSNDPLDHDDFALLVKEHRTALLRHALRSTHNGAAADDVVQETFIRAYRAYARLQPGSHLGPWLHQILANVCIDEAHRRHRETAKLERFSGEASVMARDFSTEQQLGLDSDHESLEAALASLPIEYRQALTMRFVDELSYHELANSVGVTEQNARARVSRARHAVIVAMRGAAVLPLTAYFWLRKGRRASAAFDRTQAVALTPTSSGAGGAMSANRLATSLAPAIDAANNLVTAAPAVAPLLARVAAGVTIAAAAATSFSIGDAPSSAATRTPDPAPFNAERQQPVLTLTAPSVTTIVVVTSPPARTNGTSSNNTTFSGVDPAPPPNIPLSPVDPLIDSSGEQTTVAAPTNPPLTITPSSAPLQSVPESAPSIPVPPVAAAIPESSVVAAVTTELVDASVDPNATGVPITDATAGSEDTASIETAPESSTLPIALVGGTLSVRAVAVTRSDDRFDLSGSGALTFGSRSIDGSVVGWMTVATEVQPDGSQRLNGSLTITFVPGISVRLELSGITVIHSDGSTTLDGQFQALGDTLDLVSSGMFSGTIGSSLALYLRP